MSPPPGWKNPITVAPGQTQAGIDPRLLLPARKDLIRARLELQRSLISSGQPRLSPILVTPDGVIYDGHHAVRAAAEEGISVEVVVVDDRIPAAGPAITDLPVR